MDGSLRALPGILDTQEIPPVPGVAICMMGAWTASPPAAITQRGLTPHGVAWTGSLSIT